MATSASRVTVGTSAAVIAVSASCAPALIRNRGSVPVYLGGAAVTTADGYQLDASEAVSWDLIPGELVYAIAGTAGQRVDVLRGGA